MKLNPTLKKFHYPDSLIKEYKHWYLLLRPEQVTFGSMVLIEKDLKKKLSLINKNSFVELKLIVKKIENYFLNILKFNKINYLILMMKDPHTHIHIIPRHRKDKKFNKISIKDFAYPLPPNLFKKNKINQNDFFKLKEYLKVKLN